ncbi:MULTISPECIES: hypothetical protein [unclassified Geodermatophilus]
MSTAVSVERTSPGPWERLLLWSSTRAAGLAAAPGTAAAQAASAR